MKKFIEIMKLSFKIATYVWSIVLAAKKRFAPAIILICNRIVRFFTTGKRSFWQVLKSAFKWIVNKTLKVFKYLFSEKGTFLRKLILGMD
ncbi:MAG: hypothetical protein K6B52_04695 [Clostridiales bacterium]|nr:hypothetical protein [Clostridiales bacterium]